MLLELLYISAINTMDVTPLQDNDEIAAITAEYLENKNICKLGIIKHFEQHPLTIDRTGTTEINPIANGDNTKGTTSDVFAAIHHVISNGFYLEKKFLDFKVGNQPLGGELAYLKSNLLAVGMYNEKINQVFTFILDSIKNIVIQTSIALENNDEELNMEKCTNVFVYLLNLTIVATTFANDNLLVQKGTQLSYSNNNKQQFSNNANYNIHKFLEHTNIPFYNTSFESFNNSMEAMFVLLFRKHGLTNELKTLTYDYYIFTNILSSINQFFSVLIVMSNLAIFNIQNNNTSDISDEQKDYLILLFDAVSECNINLALAFIDVKGMFVIVTENFDRYPGGNLPIIFFFDKEKRRLCATLEHNHNIPSHKPLIINN